jgi:hypothetical protein
MLAEDDIGAAAMGGARADIANTVRPMRCDAVPHVGTFIDRRSGRSVFKQRICLEIVIVA